MKCTTSQVVSKVCASTIIPRVRPHDDGSTRVDPILLPFPPFVVVRSPLIRTGNPIGRDPCIVPHRREKRMCQAHCCTYSSICIGTSIRRRVVVEMDESRLKVHVKKCHD